MPQSPQHRLVVEASLGDKTTPAGAAVDQAASSAASNFFTGQEQSSVSTVDFMGDFENGLD